MFQEYIEQQFESKLFWESIKMNFKFWTKKEWDTAMNDNIWSMIKKYCIAWGV